MPATLDPSSTNGSTESVPFFASMTTRPKPYGLIPMASLRQFKAYSTKRMRILMTPWTEGENPLWVPVEGFGVKVHDYLQWNPSKDEENERRRDSKDRMRAIREGRKTVGVAPVALRRPVGLPEEVDAHIRAKGSTGAGAVLAVLASRAAAERCGWDDESRKRAGDEESLLHGRTGLQSRGICLRVRGGCKESRPRL